MSSSFSVGIRVQDLHKSFGPVHALVGLTARFESGLLHGIIGPDGAGKTTFIRMLMGLLRPDSGSVLFEGVDSAPIPFSQVRPHMAYMPQQQSLYPDLSISEHLDFFRDLYQLPSDIYRDRRADLLRITRLEPFQDRPAGKLSGGMYKKLGLMCALLASPEALFLDEPTNGVDPISRREFWELLYRLREQKILILIATAYMDEAERCDRVHLLDSGRLLEEGAPQDILAREKASTFDEVFLRRAGAVSS